MSQDPPRQPSTDVSISEEKVHAALRRAAQLQAEAAERLDEKACQRIDGQEVAGPAGHGYLSRDVEAAAVEAGISPEYIRQALVEQNALGEYAEELPAWVDGVSNKMLKTRERSIELSRLIQADPATVLDAMQRIFPAHPYVMTLVDSIGGHPLEGGTLVFQLPRISVFSASTGNSSFAYTATAVDLLQIHVSMRAVPIGSGTGCEVVFRGDLRTGLRRNSWAGIGVAGVGGSFGAIVTAAAAVATGVGFPIGLALVGLGAGGLSAANGLGYGAIYRYYLKKMIAELETLLKMIDTSVRTRGAFRLPQPPGPSGDSFPLSGY